LAACSPGSVVSIRFNDGQGKFSGGSEVPVLVAAQQLQTGDVDGDGDVDLVVYTQTAGQTVASIRLNQGNGTFAGGSELAVLGGTGDLTLGDIDNDGDLDILTTGFTSGYIYSCLNQGGGRFTASTTYLLGNNPAAVVLADVDADGKLDMLVGCAGSNTVETRLNTGQGQFAPTGSSVAVGNYPQYLYLTDLDSDGDVDLLTGNQSGGSVSIRFNNASGLFSGGSDLALNGRLYGLTVGDLDGDRDIDLVASVYSSQARFKLGFNQAPPCLAADTTVAVLPAGVVTLPCGQGGATLRASPPRSTATATYEWQWAPTAGAWQVLPTGNNKPEYMATQPGRYRVQVRQGSCVATSAAMEVRLLPALDYPIPTVFTPNGDYVNEVFELRLTAPRTFELQIFNRWGRQVFTTSKYGDFWTGAGAGAGLYYYQWRYSTECEPTERIVKGTVTLLR
jgi:gliding motility-associated-like protein